MTKEQVIRMNAKEFMTELYRGVPPDKVTYIFTLPDHATYPYTIGQMDRMLDKARAFNESKDVYFGLHLMEEPPFLGGRAAQMKSAVFHLSMESMTSRGRHIRKRIFLRRWRNCSPFCMDWNVHRASSFTAVMACIPTGFCRNTLWSTMKTVN